MPLRKFIRHFACALVLCALILGFLPQASAGYLELGVSGSYKQSYIDTDSWELTTAYTASVDWYFALQSALELSYTNGSQQTYLHFDDRPSQTTTNYFELVGLDFVYTFFSPEVVVRPYLKGGAAYLLRKDLVFDTAGQTVVLNQDTGLVPSAGAGAKISITRDFAIKLGVDGWASTPGTAKRWDYVARAGVSWMF